MHTLDAHYSGDSRNQASDSGEQTAVVAGNTSVEVLGTSGPSRAATVVPVSVN
jgi:hypothetical protein